MQDGARIWRESLAELERVARPWILAVWLRPTTGLDDDESFLTVAVPSVFHKQYLEQELPRLIASAVCAAGYGTLRVQYCVSSLPGADDHRAGTAPGGVCSFEPLPPDPVPAHMFTWPALQLNPRWTFESFIMTKGNRHALAACRQLGNTSGGPSNLLVIWGRPGLGKTHLLHAIAHQGLIRRNANQILLTSAEQFLHRLIVAIQRARVSEFRRSQRDATLLLVDDIDLLAGSGDLQEEFVDSFKALDDGNTQIVWTSALPIGAMSWLEAGVLMRFGGGTIAEVQPPDRAERIAVLQARAVQRAASIPPDVLEYLAEHIEADVRRLDGALDQVIFLAELQGAPVDLEVAVEAITHRSQGVLPRRDTLRLGQSAGR